MDANDVDITIDKSLIQTEEELLAHWGEFDNPLVSIHCMTYNHEKFIRDTLDGFLIQKTDFPFEILVHDDASTDGTADIIREYEKRYPNIIKPIYQTVNQYSQGKKCGVFNRERARGEYIAICEGDDHWLDRNKLQIQIDFLRNHQDYVMSGHDAIVVNEKGEVISESKLPNTYKKDISGEDLIRGRAWILTMSMVFRNVFVKEEMPIEHTLVKNGDVFLTSILGSHGKSKYHSDISPAVYNAHRGGIWSMISPEKKAWHTLNTNFWLKEYYERIGEKEHAEYYRRKHKLLLAHQVGFFYVFLTKLLKVRVMLFAIFNRITKNR